VRNLALRECADGKATVAAPPSRYAYASEHADEIAELIQSVVGRPIKLTVEQLGENEELPAIFATQPEPGATGEPAPDLAAKPENDPEDHPLVKQVIEIFNAKVVRKDRDNG
jgi:hypothetical protein